MSMQISEQELREMIRDAIARHRVGAHQPTEAGRRGVGPQSGASHQMHPSQLLFAVVPSGDGDCIIEPAVRCNHCGYCKSYGH
jgi:hypothetical protein